MKESDREYHRGVGGGRGGLSIHLAQGRVYLYKPTYPIGLYRRSVPSDMSRTCHEKGPKVRPQSEWPVLGPVTARQDKYALGDIY